jgi:eukaryotic-like serine/threonine-protein kinase
MGHVFLARDTQLDRDVAIKMLPPALAADPVSRERLRREARAAAALDHPFICKVFEVTETDGQLVIVMELVTGETLHERLTKGPVAIDQAIAWAGEIAEALEAAHDRRIVHRDLKPGNVMATLRGHLKVMDFGLAKVMGADSKAETALGDPGAAPLTDRSARIGTPAYMAPEQIAGDVVDHRSDIFAFGVLLTELVTGVHPFSRPTLAGTVTAVLKDPPIVGHAAAPPVPSSLRAVLHRMLEKAPGDRYQSMREVRADLANLRAAASSTGRLLDASVSVGHTGRAQRWPMVGRDAERAELVGRLEDAMAGRGSLTLIGGEPGIGKTRLTEDVLDDARRRGCFCLTGHCYEMEGAPPYVPFIEITERTARVVPASALRTVLGDAAPEIAKLMPELRRMFDDIPPPIELPAEQQRRFFFNAYRDFVERACRANPLAIVFEDLHWADEPTLQLLMHLLQAVPSLPVLVIGTYRDVELDVTRPFAKVLETMLRQRLASRMTLRRLPSEGVAALLSAMSGRPAPASLARVIYKETEGNPFFVEEVFQHLQEEGRLFDASGAWRQDLRVESLDVPEGVRLVIGRRLERLTEATRRILTTAAVIGRTFSLRLLESLEAAGDDVLDAIEAAEGAHLVSSQTGARETRYLFAHELIRQTLAESLSLPRRQRLHAKIAAAIERVYASGLDAHVSAIAHHLYQAGAAADSAKTTGFLIRAAEQARVSAAHEDALELIDRALSLWEGEANDVTADLTLRRALTLRSLGRPGEALDAFARASAMWTRLGVHDRAATAVAESAHTRMWLMDAGTAVRELEAALRGLTELSPASRSRLRYLFASMQGTLGDIQGAAASLDAADRLRASVSDADLDQLGVRSWSWFEWHTMRPTASLALARQAGAAHARRGELWHEVDAIWTIPWNLYFLGRPTEALRELADYEAKAERIGHQGARWVSRHARSVLQMAAGESARAEQTAREALEIGERSEIPWVYHTKGFLAQVAIWQGRGAEGLRTLRDIAAAEPPLYWYPSSKAVLFAELAALAPDEARALHAAGAVSLVKEGERATAGFWVSLVRVAAGLMRLGYRDELVAIGPWIDELAASDRVVPGGWLPPSAVAAGLVNWARRDWERAEADFVRAVRQMDDAPFQHLRGEPREWYAAMLVERESPGDRDRARQLLDEATKIYRALGFEGSERRVEELR